MQNGEKWNCNHAGSTSGESRQVGPSNARSLSANVNYDYLVNSTMPFSSVSINSRSIKSFAYSPSHIAAPPAQSQAFYWSNNLVWPRRVNYGWLFKMKRALVRLRQNELRIYSRRFGISASIFTRRLLLSLFFQSLSEPSLARWNSSAPTIDSSDFKLILRNVEIQISREMVTTRYDSFTS